MPAKVRGSKSRRPPQARVAAARKTSPRTGSYFLSLTLKDVRCFGPMQTLDLSDGQGRPAHWTVILGNNGVGKTTLLQSLAAFEPSKAHHKNPATGKYQYIPGILGGVSLASGTPWNPARRGVDWGRISASLVSGRLLGEHRFSKPDQEVSVIFWASGNTGGTAVDDRYLDLRA